MSRLRTFILSELPPSINRQNKPYRNSIIKSKECRDWYQASQFELLNQSGFGGSSACPDFLWRSEILFPCNVSRMDIDNASKAIHDLLVRCNKVPDDRYLVDHRVRWSANTNLTILIRKEEFEKWSKIKQFSKQLARKLARN